MTNFLHKKVSYKKIGIIFGIFALVILSASAIDHNTPPSENVAEVSSDTVSGDFYINREKGFTVKFPAETKITESDDGSVYGDIGSPHQSKIMVSSFGSSDSVPTDYVITDVTSLENKATQLADQTEQLFGSKPVVIDSGTFNVDGVPAYFVGLDYEESRSKVRSYSLLKNSHFYEIAIIYSSDDESYSSQMFDEFISSFKVLD